MKKIYVAGPMRGLPEFNFPAFFAAATRLRMEGWSVFNPAERDIQTGFDPTGSKGTSDELEAVGFDLRGAFGADTDWICHEADAIYLLRGWRNSTGAVAERALAEALGLEVYEQELPVQGKTTLVRDSVREIISGVHN